MKNFQKEQEIVSKIDLESTRPFILVDGRRYVLAEGETLPEELNQLTDSDRWREISDPPRPVSLAAKFFLFFRSDPAMSFGLIFGFMGLFFLFVFLSSVSIRREAVWQDLGSWVAVEERAEQISSQPCNFSINEKNVYCHTFFAASDLNRSEPRKCYSFSEEVSDRLEESERTPGVYRLEKTTLSVCDVTTILLFLFFLAFVPTIGSLFVFWSFPRRGRSLWLLKWGSKAKAVPIQIEETGTRVNAKSVKKICYQFQTESGEKRETSVRILNERWLTDEPYEIVFYDPAKPQKTFFLDEAAHKIRWEMGRGFCLNRWRIGWIFTLLLTVTYVAGGVLAIYSLFMEQSPFEILGIQ